MPAAAAAVAAVPEDFVYETEHATTPAALHNGVFEAFNNGEFGVFDQEGTNGLNYVSAEDLRVQGDSGLGSDLNTESWFPSKYANFECLDPDGGLHRGPADHRRERVAGRCDSAAMTDRLNALRALAGLPEDIVGAG